MDPRHVFCPSHINNSFESWNVAPWFNARRLLIVQTKENISALKGTQESKLLGSTGKPLLKLSWTNYKSFKARDGVHPHPSELTVIQLGWGSQEETRWGHSSSARESSGAAWKDDVSIRWFLCWLGTVRTPPTSSGSWSQCEMVHGVIWSLELSYIMETSRGNLTFIIFK